MIGDLVELAGTISRIAADMGRRRTTAAREQLAFKWAEIPREQGEQLAEQAKSVAEGIPKTSVGIVAGTAVISVLLQEITKSGCRRSSPPSRARPGLTLHIGRADVQARRQSSKASSAQVA